MDAQHTQHVTYKDQFDILGYMSGPIIVESTDEREARGKQVVVPEAASTTRISL
jgi:hypothetical protein